MGTHLTAVTQRKRVSRPPTESWREELYEGVGQLFAPEEVAESDERFRELNRVPMDTIRADGFVRYPVFHRDVLFTEYAQYAHLNAIDDLIRQDPNLRITVGRDYLIKPDVVVGLLGTRTVTPEPWMHAAVSCKWSIRSDRVQNIRHEFGQMIRHRRGRQPHLVTVTAEPLPTRLASIARGTGEVDATYHVAFNELDAAVTASSNAGQQAAWAEVVGQGRLRDFDLLTRSLLDW